MKTREKLTEQILSIPWWRRVLICCINRRQWKIARAYNWVGVDLMHSGNWELGNLVRNYGDLKWAKLYDIDAPKPIDEKWESRAHDAECDLKWAKARIAELENQISLFKNTSAGLSNLRRMKKLPPNI